MLQTSYKLSFTELFDEGNLSEGLYLVVIHASRIPPHIGIIAGGKYHSLTIKGQETDQPLEILMKNIRIRKIPSLFIKINSSLLSDDLLREHVVRNVRQFPKAAADGATCLSPVKLFFEQAFSVSMQNIQYLFELLPKLEEENLLENVSSLNISGEEFELPVYDLKTIYREIDKANREAELIRSSRNLSTGK